MITSADAVGRLLAAAPALPDPPPGIRVFVSAGETWVEVAPGNALHRRVAAAVALQLGDLHRNVQPSGTALP